MTRWTEDEDAILRSTYPDYKALMAKLPSRSYFALRTRCGALGLRPKRHVWTAREIRLLHEIGQVASKAELIAAFPGITIDAINSRRWAVGLGRCYFRLKSGIPFWDRVMAEAIRQGMSNADIDRALGVGRRFTRQTHLGDHDYIRAAEALGGKVTIVWDE